MKRRNLCLECEVKGLCCYLSVDLEGHNVVLNNQPCRYLDRNTGLCVDYENRFNKPWCKNGENKFLNGSLPAECLYLKDRPEKKVKVSVVSVADKLSPESMQQYNFLNNNPYLWDVYIKEGLKDTYKEVKQNG